MTTSEQNNDINQKNYGMTEFMYHCDNGRIEKVKELLKHTDLDINAQNKSGLTALHLCLTNPYSDMKDKIAKKLLKHPDIDLSIKEFEDNYTVLLQIASSEYENEEIINLIVDHPTTDVNETNDLGETALYNACYYNNEILFDALLRKKELDVNAYDNSRNTPLIGACINGSDVLVLRLLQHKDINIFHRNFGKESAFFSLCKKGRINLIYEFLRMFPDINIEEQNIFGLTPLIALFRDGLSKTNTVLKKSLFKKLYVDINKQDGFGKTAAINLVANGKTEVVEKYISYFLDNPDLDINTQDYLGNSILIYSILYAKVKTIELILQRDDVNIYLKNEKGDTALFYALEYKLCDYDILCYEHKKIVNNLGQNAWKYAERIKNMKELSA